MGETRRRGGGGGGGRRGHKSFWSFCGEGGNVSFAVTRGGSCRY